MGRGIAAQNKKLERLFAIMWAFAETGAAITPHELRERFYAGKSDDAYWKAFKRDRTAIIAAGFDISYKDSTKEYRHIPTPPKLTLELDDAERAAIVSALTALTKEPGFPLPLPLRAALRHLSSYTGSDFDEDALYARTALEEELTAQQDELTEIVHALSHNHALTFTYHKPDGTARSRRIRPAYLHLFRGLWYLDGIEEDSDENFDEDAVLARNYKTFRVSSMEATIAQDQVITLPVPTPEKTRFEPPFAWGDGPLVPITIIIPAARATRREAISGEGAMLIAQTDGSYLWNTHYNDIDTLCMTIIEEDLALPASETVVRAYLSNEYLERVVNSHAK